MKALTTVSLFIIVFVLCSSKANATDTTFVAGDDTVATKLCIAAVSNNMLKTKNYINRLAMMDGITSGMYTRTKFAADVIRCNNTNLVEFTAQYNAKDTFEFFNKRVEKKYRLNIDEVKVIDLARQSALPSHPQIIVITSR